MSILAAAPSPNYSNLFHCLCSNGEFEHAKTIYDKHHTNIRIRDELFCIVCMSGNLPLAQWLYAIYFRSRHQFDDEFDETYIFASTCAAGELDMAKWLYREFQRHINLQVAMQDTCAAGKLDVAKWILLQDNVVLEDIYIQENIKFDAPMFISACREDLATAQWVYEHRTRQCYDPKTYSQVFITACKTGKLDIAQWIYDIHPRVSEDLFGQVAFSGACKDGHIYVVLWLLDKFPQYIFGVKNEYLIISAFRGACYNGHLQIAKLLAEIFPNLDVNSGNSYAFRWACYNGHIELAKWIYSVSASVITDYGMQAAFEHACNGCKINVMKWMVTLDEFRRVQMNYDVLNTVCISGNVYVAQLLLQIFPNMFTDTESSTPHLLLANASIEARQELFLNACLKSGDVRLVQWIYEHYSGIDLTYDGYRVFTSVCLNDLLEIAEWMLKICPDIVNHINGSQIFVGACKNGHLSVTKWIRELIPELDITAYNHLAFKHVCKTQHLFHIAGYFHIAVYLAEINAEQYVLEADHNAERIIQWKIKNIIPVRPRPSSMPAIAELEQSECCICYESVTLQTNCGHLYCGECTDKWYSPENNPACPYCRSKVKEFYICCK